MGLLQGVPFPSVLAVYARAVSRWSIRSSRSWLTAGVDGALRSFAQSLFGPWLLILVALGLIAFGVLSFVDAKWRRTLGGVPA
jgi:hypothetical protein